MLHFLGEKKFVQKENRRMLSLFSRARKANNRPFIVVLKIVLTMLMKLGECQTFSHREWKIFVFVDSNGVSNINVALVQWIRLIGKRIEEGVLASRSEDNGEEIIKNLSGFLTKKYGEDFDRASLYFYLRFYRFFPSIFDSVSKKSFLSWTRKGVSLFSKNITQITFLPSSTL